MNLNSENAFFQAVFALKWTFEVFKMKEVALYILRNYFKIL